MEYINTLMYGASGPFRCEYNTLKGRTLRMMTDTSPCDILFQGPLLHKISEDLSHPIYIEITRLFHFDSADSLDYAPMWYWCALNSLPYKISDQLPLITSEQAKQLKMLYHPDRSCPSSTIRRVAASVSQFLDHPLSESELMDLDTMTIIWTLNCFEHADDPLTYATFFLPSFMSHSCAPTAMWTTIGDSFVLRSQRAMHKGDELTVSYLSEEFGLRPITQRRAHLKCTKFFTCDCPRCTAEVDDTRGFPIPARLGLPSNCFLRFPQWDICACGCGTEVSLTADEIAHLTEVETLLVELVTEYDGDEDDGGVPSRTDPKLIGSDEAANELESLIDEMGLFHWASARGLMQLAEYYKSECVFAQAILCTKKRIESKRKYVNLSPSETSSSLGWALEELGDLIMLHVSGAVVAVASEDDRTRFSIAWKPKNEEDRETLKFSGAAEAYAESHRILRGVFGNDHEHATIVESKLDRVSRLVNRPFR